MYTDRGAFIMNSVLDNSVLFQNYCVVSSIAYLKGKDRIPGDWTFNLSIKTEISNLRLFPYMCNMYTSNL